MALSTAFSLLGVLIFVSYAPCVMSDAKSQRLLMILLDGVRFDYLNQTSLPLPGFDKLARKGVKVEALVPDFPSLSVPNWNCLMTGLHSESHGMTGNHIYDMKREEAFLLYMYPESHHGGPRWWEGGDPIWITAARQNKKSHMFYWPGCEMELRGFRPSFCQNYTGVPSFEQLRPSLQQSLELLESGQTDLAAIYFEGTDYVGHVSGPFSAEMNDMLRDIDLIISDLVDRLSQPEMSEVNLMVFSDHGMTGISPSRIIDISEALDPSEYIVILDGFPLASIYTTPDKVEQVFNKLDNFHPNMTVYRKSDLPERWHFKNGPYVAPLTAVADIGWSIQTPLMVQKNYPFRKGMHGYDNRHSEMQGIFLAMGPAFKSGQKVEKLRTVDLYQVMCDILHIEPSPNNGSRSHLSPLLTSHDADMGVMSSITFFTLLAAVFVFLCCRSVKT